MTRTIDILFSVLLIICIAILGTITQKQWHWIILVVFLFLVPMGLSALFKDQENKSFLSFISGVFLTILAILIMNADVFEF